MLDPLHLQALIENSEEYDVKLVAYEEEAKQGEDHDLSSSTYKTLETGESLLIVFGLKVD